MVWMVPLPPIWAGFVEPSNRPDVGDDGFIRQIAMLKGWARAWLVKLALKAKACGFIHPWH